MHDKLGFLLELEKLAGWQIPRRSMVVGPPRPPRISLGTTHRSSLPDAVRRVLPPKVWVDV